MPKTRLVLFREDDGSIPLRDWLRGLGAKQRYKCNIKLERLSALGHELRRPEADYLRDGIRELRVGFQGVNYRMLYFFHGNEAVVVTHGIVKERRVPPKEIDLAILRRDKFRLDPARHSAEMDDD